MDPELLIQNGFNPHNKTIAKLENFDLFLGERATLIQKNNHTVWGTIISMTENELIKLYSTPSVSDYKCVDIICQNIEGTDIKACVYILPNDYPITPPQDGDYAKQLHTVCKKMSLPSDYCDRIHEMMIEIETNKKTQI